MLATLLPTTLLHLTTTPRICFQDLYCNTPLYRVDTTHMGKAIKPEFLPPYSSGHLSHCIVSLLLMRSHYIYWNTTVPHQSGL
jgi:hypothetical protein